MEWGLIENIFLEWGATQDGKFTTKSAYLTQAGSNTNNNNNNSDFTYIWKWKGNERICTFLWKLGR